MFPAAAAADVATTEHIHAPKKGLTDNARHVM